MSTRELEEKGGIDEAVITQAPEDPPGLRPRGPAGRRPGHARAWWRIGGIALAVALIGLVVGVVIHSGPAARTTSRQRATAANPAPVVVAVPGDHFSPAYLTVRAGTTVTWSNTDTDPHMVSTAPGLAPVSFNLPLPAGGTASYTFMTPGLYVYYCPMHAVWDSTTGLPKPDPGTDVYPEAMAGVVSVVSAQ